MATPAVRRAGAPYQHWARATLLSRAPETGTARTLVLRAPGWPGHLPGQHIDIRLTADDGYQAARSYSLAAPGRGEHLEVGVQPVDDGEVSPYLAEDLPVGADVEIRGPLGGWFVWRPDRATAPLLLLAGGSGVVPLMAMLRGHRTSGARVPARLVYSVRDPAQVWYGAELAAVAPPVSVRLLHTSTAPPGDPRPPGRIMGTDLPGSDSPFAPGVPDVFVCGPTGFVEYAADLLLLAGHPADRVRTERFG
ncbi:FAD-binding oxidoreductase [Streptomyces sp. NRRL F-5630]|uniref:FAD-binding oxidoreductase n=1 Tax=Streptomyces sp. NRRL F-5630 TaxID=1463864 RepID=UPI0004C821ED|nr:FAD-binding oxidoreductase [Streptomyces sp. NRRL F-5630]